MNYLSTTHVVKIVHVIQNMGLGLGLGLGQPHFEKNTGNFVPPEEYVMGCL